MKSLIHILIIMLVCGVSCLPALATVDIDEAQIAGTYSQAGNTISLGLLVGTPIDAINGFAYGDWQRAQDEGEVLAENATLYLEGGVPIFGFALNGYVKGLKDEGRIEGWQRDYGYFLRLPEYKWRGFILTGGGGNFARQEIPEIGVEAMTSFNWRGFLQFKHISGLNLLIETTSTLGLKDPEFRLLPFTSIEVGDHFTLDLSLEILRADGETHNQVMIAGKKTFDKIF